MSIIDQDILNQTKPLIYVLISKEEKNIIGVFNDINIGLKQLYLSDETSILLVNYFNYVSKPYINDTYDCFLGSFSFDDDNNLIYKRNLTDQIEKVNESQFLNTKDSNEIQITLDQIDNLTKTKVDLNNYHKKAHKVVDEAISKKFHQLSTLTTQKLNKLINHLNHIYDLGIEFDTTINANQLYQDSNKKIAHSDLEEKIDMIKTIRQSILNAENELKTMRELAKECGETGFDDDVDVDVSCVWDGTNFLCDPPSPKKNSQKSVNFNLDKTQIHKFSGESNVDTT